MATTIAAIKSRNETIRIEMGAQVSFAEETKLIPFYKTHDDVTYRESEKQINSNAQL